MATGLNASVTTATSQAVISSSAYNSNIANLNGAANPSFLTFATDGVISTDGNGQATFNMASGKTFPITINVPSNDLKAIKFVPGDATKEIFSWYRNLNIVDYAFEVFREPGNSFSALAYFYIDSSGNLTLPNGHGHLSTLHSISASGTITHGLGYTPTEVKTECSITSSNTTGHDSIGSTTYHVTLGAAQANDSYAG